MTVAAVVPHWNRRNLLEELLSSIRAQTVPFDEVIVVDNGSTDGSVECAEGWGARVVPLARNFGFAAAVNRGIEATRADWIAILNNDVRLDAEWLGNLLAGSGNASFATGKILRAGNIEVIDGAFDEVSRGACACRCGFGKPDSAVWNQPRKIRFASMTAALFRRDVFLEIGLLDESFGSYMEDVDFGLRAALAGRNGVYVPSAIAYHRGSATLGVWNSETVRHISRNQVILARKYFGGQPRWPILAGQLLWGILAFRHSKGFAWLRGKFSGLSYKNGVRSDSREGIRAIVESSERSIFELGQQTGFDWYWRAYFWLLRR
ncbi:MAG: glycosyltransferase family 2 protein [Bryobacteraceae bacterium]